MPVLTAGVNSRGRVSGARELLAEGASCWLLKAQVKTGGRGKAGGVKLAHTADEAYEKAEATGLDITATSQRRS